jgi:thiosulfate reductase cytochrome b subunit
MITSGLQIYNANPVFGGREGWHFKFSSARWLVAGGRNWHFAAMWFYSLNLLWYGLYVVLVVGGNDLRVAVMSKRCKSVRMPNAKLCLASVSLYCDYSNIATSSLTGLTMYKPNFIG